MHFWKNGADVWRLIVSLLMVAGLGLGPAAPARAELGKEWVPGSTFTARTGQTSVVFNNKIWIIGGSGDGVDVWSSADGVRWDPVCTFAPFHGRTYHSSVVFKDKLWVIGGLGPGSGGLHGSPGEACNDVWCSDDGVQWTSATLQAAFPARDGHTSVVFDNKMWVIGGSQTTFQKMMSGGRRME